MADNIDKSLPNNREGILAPKEQIDIDVDVDGNESLASFSSAVPVSRILQPRRYYTSYFWYQKIVVTVVCACTIRHKQLVRA